MYLNFARLGICYLNLFVFCIEDRLYSQTHKPFHTTINAKCGGYYEYLPSNYDPSGPKQYPLILFVHGLGDNGNGRMPDLNKVLLSGLPTYIDRNKFPASFTVNGNQFSFIVISPQFSAWPNAQDVQDVLNYTLAKYKVDVSRIYITGLSMGGGATWDYAQSSFTAASGIAAIVPVCGDSDPLAGTPEIIGQANLPVWATHNSGDPAVLVWKTDGFIDAI